MRLKERRGERIKDKRQDQTRDMLNKIQYNTIPNRERPRRHQKLTRSAQVPVVGAFKPAILRRMSALSVSRWRDMAPGGPVVGADLPPLSPGAAHSARLVSAHRPAVIDMSRVVSLSRNPGLLRFWVLAVTEHLPVERRLVVSRRAPSRDHSCKLCGAQVETVRACQRSWWGLTCPNCGGCPEPHGGADLSSSSYCHPSGWHHLCCPVDPGLV